MPDSGPIDGLLIAQREDFQGGRRCPPEEYLARVPGLAGQGEALLQLVVHEMLLRQEAGESPQLEDYQRRFPQLASGLPRFFDLFPAFLNRSHCSLNGAEQSTLAPATQPRPPDLEGPPAAPPWDAGSASEKTTLTQAPAGTPAVPGHWPRLEGYQILAELGSGGMGVVYRAYDRQRQGVVALKIMQRASPQALRRFKQEFRALADVAHPNLVTLYDLISDGQQWFFTMELVEGTNFLSYVRRGPSAGSAVTDDAVENRPAGLSPAQLGRLRAALLQLAEGIEALHTAGKLHRDLKPGNVFVTAEGRVVVLDFGLAVELDLAGLYQSTEQHLVGTLAYMAPEQAASKPVSLASDWYSLGVMLYEGLTGRLPFSGSLAEMISAKRDQDPPAPREVAPGTPEDLDALCCELLRRDPADRPPAAEVLSRLRRTRPCPVPVPLSPQPPTTSGLLVGREQHLAALRKGLDSVRGGRPVLMHIAGRSGAGKSALVRYFLDELAAEGGAVVLAGRCYEREAVPYKALDSLIDALGSHLARLPILEAQALLPRDTLPLVRLFPVFGRVEAVARAPQRGADVPDQQELRRRAFAALRDLLGRLGDRGTLVLCIDDLQWGDLDSADLLDEVLGPPDPPVCLFLACYRSEDTVSSPFLKQFLAPRPSRVAALDRRDMSVDALSSAEARDLALVLLDGADPVRITQAAAIARESGGNPFFIHELVRYLQAGVKSASKVLPTGGVTLHQVIHARCTCLPEGARALLEIVAVAGKPLREADACAAAGVGSGARAALAVLRSGQLIRGVGPIDRQEIDTYHDRVRESVIARLTPDSLADHHRSLALTLEASGSNDPEFLGLYFLGAGNLDRAGHYYALAAGQAAKVLAFDNAATLYGLALDLGLRNRGDVRQLRIKLGEALANAGRGGESARQYLGAASGGTLAEATQFRQQAALQLLISGHFDEGVETLREVLRLAGLGFPKTPRRALWSLLLRRAQLRLRGLGFRPRPIDRIAPNELTRIDACTTAAIGLTMIDALRGAYFQTSSLLLALSAGEPDRIARAIAMEAAHAATRGGPTSRRTSDLLKVAHATARGTTNPHTLGVIVLGEGFKAYFEGRWKEARESCERAEEIFRSHCTGVWWELNAVQALGLYSCFLLGEVASITSRLPVLLQEAERRRDLHAVANLKTGPHALIQIVADKAEEARRELDEFQGQWSQQGFHIPHFSSVSRQIEIDLYCGQGEAAWRRITSVWPALVESGFLHVQLFRIMIRSQRAFSALAAARGGRRTDLLDTAEREARRLEREKMPWADPLARLIRVGVAGRRGEAARAASLLADAANLFDAVQMSLWAAATRRRLGEVRGGREGQDLIDQGNAFMKGQQIRNPARMTDMLVPACRIGDAESDRAGEKAALDPQ